MNLSLALIILINSLKSIKNAFKFPKEQQLKGIFEYQINKTPIECIDKKGYEKTVYLSFREYIYFGEQKPIIWESLFKGSKTFAKMYFINKLSENYKYKFEDNNSVTFEDKNEKTYILEISKIKHI